MRNNYRYLFLDISKGLLIILVVIGHSGSFLTKYIYWFHMPAFFFISGLLFKSPETGNKTINYLIKKYKNFGVLYLSYFILVILLSLLYTKPAEFNINKTFLKLVVGGRYVGRELGVFWFISCLAFSLTIFTLIQFFIKQKPYQILVLILLYLLSHLESYLILNNKFNLVIPLNLDVALLAVCYTGTGYYLKDWIFKLLENKRSNFKAIITTLIIAILAIILNLHKIIDYKLDMKFVTYIHIIGDIFIPLVFTVLVLSLSNLITRTYIFLFLKWFGYYSIVIMFLHLIIKEIILYYVTSNWIVISAFGSIIPLLFAIMFDKNKITRFLFIKGKM